MTTMTTITGHFKFVFLLYGYMNQLYIYCLEHVLLLSISACWSSIEASIFFGSFYTAVLFGQFGTGRGIIRKVEGLSLRFYAAYNDYRRL